MHTVPRTILDYEFLFLIGSCILLRIFDTSSKKINEYKNTNLMTQNNKRVPKKVDENII